MFADKELRPKWDEMYSHGVTLEIIDMATCTFSGVCAFVHVCSLFLTAISYNAFHAPWPVSPRDFCVLGRTVVRLKHSRVVVLSALCPSHSQMARSSSFQSVSNTQRLLHCRFVLSVTFCLRFDQCPPVSGYVRGRLIYGGTLCEVLFTLVVAPLL